MHGLIMDFQLTIPAMLRRAEQLHYDREIVTRLPDKSLHRYTYGDMIERAKRLSVALAKLGVDDGDRVATFCWNHYQHLEAYMAIPCAGAVLHTLNLRLHANDLTYIASHAGDKVVIVDEVLWDAVRQVSRDGPLQARDRRPLRATSRCRRARSTTKSCWPTPTSRKFVYPGPRRAAGRRHVLHLGHDRHAQGRAGFAPRDRAALDGQRHGRHAGPVRARHGDGRGADVPRQRLGPAVHLPVGRREAGLSRAVSSIRPACSS